MDANRLGYRASLDGLRAIAVSLVVAFHLQVLPGGFIGVDIFFVLSGYLVTTLLLEEHEARGRISIPQFYARRALRLLPALALLLAVCAPFVTRAWLIAVASYGANWFIALGKLGTGPLSHSWSLAIEEQFYLVWPLLLVVLLRARLSRRGLLLVVLALAAISALAKALVTLDPDAGSWVRAYHGTDTRADALLLGCAAALLPRGTSHRAWAVIAAVALAFVAVTAHLRDLALYRGELTAVAVASAVVVRELVARGVRWLELPPIVWLGRISYGVYLWHHPIVYLHVPTIVKPALAVAAAALSFVAVERPALALKQRFTRSA